MTTPRIEKVLRVSIDKLYIGSEEFLAEIEAGLGTAAVFAPKVGYQGVAGSFGEQAALEYFGGTASAVTNYKEFDDVFAALERGEIDYGVLPIENSTAGDVLEVADLITRCSLYVIGEHIIRVRPNLLGVSGASTGMIREVYSHPQAISQCRDFLRHHPEINAYPYANTALAAKFIAEEQDPPQKPPSAACGPQNSTALMFWKKTSRPRKTTTHGSSSSRGTWRSPNSPTRSVSFFPPP